MPGRNYGGAANPGGKIGNSIGQAADPARVSGGSSDELRGFAVQDRGSVKSSPVKEGGGGFSPRHQQQGDLGVARTRNPKNAQEGVGHKPLRRRSRLGDSRRSWSR